MCRPMVATCFGFRGSFLERGDLCLQLCGSVRSPRLRLGIAALPALVLGGLDGVLHGAKARLEWTNRVAGHLSDGRPAFQDVAVRGPGSARVTDRQQRLGLGQQSSPSLER